MSDKELLPAAVLLLVGAVSWLTAIIRVFVNIN